VATDEFPQAPAGARRPDLCLLLDVDGTLLDFAPRPEAVVVPAGLAGLLAALVRELDGAFALVSGRALESLDALFRPLHFAAVALHGIQVRAAPDAAVETAEFPPLPAVVLQTMDQLAASHAGAFIEKKGCCVVLHHDLAAAAQSAAEAELTALLAREAPAWAVMKGRKVLELKPKAVNKGTGCERLLRLPAFRARLPVYLGDDTTDLDGFAVVERVGGVAVGVGPRVGHAAAIRLAGPREAREWLEELLEALRAGGDAMDRFLQTHRETAD
jgi:trehalose 6-phosphate phosphatase